MQSVHPTSTAGSARSDQLEQNQVHCSMCGWVNDKNTTPPGGVDTLTYSTGSYVMNSLTKYYGQPTVNSGCNLCGSPVYDSKPRRLRGGSTNGNRKRRRIS